MSPLFEDEFQDTYYKGRKPAGYSSVYYVVFIGREIGIYDNWNDAKLQTDGVSKSYLKSYYSYREAEIALREYLNTGMLPMKK